MHHLLFRVSLTAVQCDLDLPRTDGFSFACISNNLTPASIQRLYALPEERFDFAKARMLMPLSSKYGNCSVISVRISPVPTRPPCQDRPMSWPRCWQLGQTRTLGVHREKRRWTSP